MVVFNYSKCRQEGVVTDENNFWEGECAVILRDDEIVVSYREDKKIYEYKGIKVYDGGWKLTCPEVKGSAKLFLSIDEKGIKTLIGKWVEDGQEGFWEITLDRNPKKIDV